MKKIIALLLLGCALLASAAPLYAGAVALARVVARPTRAAGPW
jgi:hypothetical protein